MKMCPLALSAGPQIPFLHVPGQHILRTQLCGEGRGISNINSRTPDPGAVLWVWRLKSKNSSWTKLTDYDAAHALASLGWHYMMLVHPNNIQTIYYDPNPTLHPPTAGTLSRPLLWTHVFVLLSTSVSKMKMCPPVSSSRP